MYESFYGLKKRPFMTLPDPQFLYMSHNHELGLSMLRYSLMNRAPLSVVTGEIGAGKTTLVRQLLAEAPNGIELGLISNMSEGRGELLQWILMAFDRPYEDGSYVKLFKAFQDFVLETYAEGRHVVLIFDEAQNCSTEILEEIRMLTNINSDQDELLQLILIGQPQLRAMIASRELVQFSQRITCDYHLGGLTKEETGEYVAHRLKVAGASRTIFESGTTPIIHRATRGIPRVINVLCDLALVYGFSDDIETISGDLLQEVLDDAKRRGIFRQFVTSTSESPTIEGLDKPSAKQSRKR